MKLNKKYPLLSYYILGMIIVILAIAIGISLILHLGTQSSCVILSNPPSEKSHQPASDKQASLVGGHNSGTNSSPNTSQKNLGSAQTTSLIAPYGNFVSNHKPGQNGAPFDENSVCNTTPGATCYIQFTMGSQTKKLEGRIADEGGVASWDWTASNLASGKWIITAVATLNGQSKSTQDDQPLEIP